MSDAATPGPEPDPEREAATKAQVLAAAERLFALNGFQNVSVRDITAEAGVNLASVNYHFGSKDQLLFEIFRRRTSELNRERARMLHEASDRHGGKPPGLPQPVLVHMRTRRNRVEGAECESRSALSLHRS